MKRTYKLSRKPKQHVTPLPEIVWRDFDAELKQQLDAVHQVDKQRLERLKAVDREIEAMRKVFARMGIEGDI